MTLSKNKNSFLNKNDKYEPLKKLKKIYDMSVKPNTIEYTQKTSNGNYTTVISYDNRESIHYNYNTTNSYAYNDDTRLYKSAYGNFLYKFFKISADKKIKNYTDFITDFLNSDVSVFKDKNYDFLNDKFNEFNIIDDDYKQILIMSIFENEIVDYDDIDYSNFIEYVTIIKNALYYLDIHYQNNDLYEKFLSALFNLYYNLVKDIFYSEYDEYNIDLNDDEIKMVFEGIIDDVIGVFDRYYDITDYGMLSSHFRSYNHFLYRLDETLQMIFYRYPEMLLYYKKEYMIYYNNMKKIVGEKAHITDYKMEENNYLFALLFDKRQHKILDYIKYKTNLKEVSKNYLDEMCEVMDRNWNREKTFFSILETDFKKLDISLIMKNYNEYTKGVKISNPYNIDKDTNKSILFTLMILLAVRKRYDTLFEFIKLYQKHFNIKDFFIEHSDFLYFLKNEMGHEKLSKFLMDNNISLIHISEDII